MINGHVRSLFVMIAGKDSNKAPKYYFHGGPQTILNQKVTRFMETEFYVACT